MLADLGVGTYLRFLDKRLIVEFSKVLDDKFMTLDYVQSALGKNATVYFQYYALFNALPLSWKTPQVDDWVINEPTFWLMKRKRSLL